MLKLCIFVEGQTERIFLEKFFSEYLGHHNLSIDSYKLFGNKLRQIRGKDKKYRTLYYIQIFDAGNDVKVMSALKERCENLTNQGFKYLFALRDVYPNKRTNIPQIKSTFYELFKNSVCDGKAKLILAIMEIEAWFIADYKVFSRIDSTLSPDVIFENIGIELYRINPESLPHPSVTINKIFGIVGKNYKKHEDQAYNIVYNLDYEFLICSNEVLNKVTSLVYLIKCINDFLLID